MDVKRVVIIYNDGTRDIFDEKKAIVSIDVKNRVVTVLHNNDTVATIPFEAIKMVVERGDNSEVQN